MSEEKHRRGRPKGTGIDDRGQLERIAALLAGDPELKPTTAIKSLGVSDPSTIRRLRDKFHDARLDLMADVAGAASPSAMASVASKPSVAAPHARGSAAAPRALPARIGEPVRRAVSPSNGASLRTPPSAVRSGAPAAKAVTQPTAAEPTPVAAEPKAVSAPPVTVEKAAPAKAKAAAPVAPKTVTAKSEAATASPPSPVITATHTNVDPASWLFTMCGFGILAASTALEAQVAWAQSLARLPPMALALRQHIALNELAMTLVTPSATTRASFH